MEPNLVGIISHGFKISWKHKILWIPNILFLIVVYIAVIPFLPFILSPFANIDGGPAPDINWQLYIGFWILLGTVLSLLEGMANSCTIVGVLRAEAGKKISEEFTTLHGSTPLEGPRTGNDRASEQFRPRLPIRRRFMMRSAVGYYPLLPPRALRGSPRPLRGNILAFGIFCAGRSPQSELWSSEA